MAYLYELDLTLFAMSNIIRYKKKTFSVIFIHFSFLVVAPFLFMCLHVHDMRNQQKPPIYKMFVCMYV